MTDSMPKKTLDELVKKFNISPDALPERKPEPVALKIENLPDRYVLHNISYHGNNCTMEWRKSQLRNGKSLSQNAWLRYCRNITWRLPDAAMYHSTLAALYNARAMPEVQPVREYFAKAFRHCLMTRSRVVYACAGIDTVVHNRWKTNQDMVGVDGYASDAFSDVLSALLGDSAGVREIYDWVAGKPPYLWRTNVRPVKDESCIVLLGTDGVNRFYLSCGPGLGDEHPALGIRLRK